MTRKNKWDYGTRNAPPNFRAGEWVIPTFALSRYPGWSGKEPRRIEEVVFEQHDGTTGRWRLKIYNPAKSIYPQGKAVIVGGYSLYNPGSFERVRESLLTNEEKSMSNTEKTKFFAIRIIAPNQIDGGLTVADHGTTPLHDFESEVRKDVRDRIQENEQWIIVQTRAKMVGEPPRPPVTITEYR